MWGAGGWLSTMAGQVKRNDPIFGWTPAANFAIWRLHPMNSGITALIVHRAGVVKLVDAPDSKSGSARSVGSIPTTRTIICSLRRRRGHPPAWLSSQKIGRPFGPLVASRVANWLRACYGRLMKVRHILPPLLFGLLFLTIITVGDALFWSVPHALEKLPPRLITVAVLTGLWLVHLYKRTVR